MTDLTLSKQLGGRLKAISDAWGHENLSETLSTIFDCLMHQWQIPQPELPQQIPDYACRVRIKPRHSHIFTQMSHISGATVSGIARSHLIQWLTISTKSTHLLHTSPQVESRLTHSKHELTQIKTDETQIQPEAATNKQERQQVSTKPPVKSEKLSARNALSDLM